MCTSHCVGHHRGCTALIMFIRQSVPESRCHPVDLSFRIFAACTLFPCQWSTSRWFDMPLPWNLSPSPYSRSLPERSTSTRTSSTQLSRLRCSVSAFPTTHPLPLTATSTASLHILTQASSPCWPRLFNWFEKKIQASLSLLVQDQEGLVVSSPSGRWTRVPNIPGLLVVNTGELLRQVLNGLFLFVFSYELLRQNEILLFLVNFLRQWANDCVSSTPHFVVNLSEKSRWENGFSSLRAQIPPGSACPSSSTAAQPM